MKNVVWMLAALLLTGCVSTSNAPDPLRLYVLDCGYLRFNDVVAFGLTNEETSVRDMFVPCYLVDHPEGQLFWDAGLDPAIAGKGERLLQAGAFQRYDRSVLDQLAEIGFPPDDIEWIALSHMHFDHSGAANYFPESHLLIQQSEYDAAFLKPEGNPVFTYEFYSELADNPRTLLDGDHDVFGDGRVIILSAPGHTPGHQVLFLDLAETGPLVLSGDLYHFRFSRTHQRTPVFNTDAEETVESMKKVEAFLEARNATLWIEHDKALADTLMKAPAFYE